MFGGFTIEKIIMIGVIAAILIGPERLPQAAEWLGRTARKTREYVQGARTRVQEEMGEDLGDVDWKKLDPRQYDPRRIVREALLDDDPLPERVSPPRPAAPVAPTGPAPFDDEAT